MPLQFPYVKGLNKRDRQVVQTFGCAHMIFAVMTVANRCKKFIIAFFAQKFPPFRKTVKNRKPDIYSLIIQILFLLCKIRLFYQGTGLTH